MRQIEYKIAEPEGLHALPATAIVVALREYQSEITATFGGRTVDAKSPIGLLSLGAKYGDVVIFIADGTDENQVKINPVTININ